MKQSKSKIGALLAVALTIFIVSPLDDIAIAAVFGTALFGFGSIPFYLLLAGSTTLSVVFWLRKRHKKELNLQLTPPRLRSKGL